MTAIIRYHNDREACGRQVNDNDNYDGNGNNNDDDNNDNNRIIVMMEVLVEMTN